jgi:hypothetical protein
MVASHVRRVSVLALLVVPALALAAQRTAPAASDGADDVVTSRFLTAADAYVVLHHRSFEPVSEEFMCLPADSIARLNALADVAREARPAPREGDVFSPDVAGLFRRRIAATLQAYDYNPADVLAEMDAEELVAPPVLVNEELPRGIGLMMPWLAGALPVLPEELAYRLVGRDFVLIDVQSNMVVDVIRAVLPLY